MCAQCLENRLADRQQTKEIFFKKKTQLQFDYYFKYTHKTKCHKFKMLTSIKEIQVLLECVFSLWKKRLELTSHQKCLKNMHEERANQMLY